VILTLFDPLLTGYWKDRGGIVNLEDLDPNLAVNGEGVRRTAIDNLDCLIASSRALARGH
jgi:hypothetical protein